MADDMKPILYNVRAGYANLTALRATVQLIPTAGGAIDTLLTGGIGKYQLRRVEGFVIDLQARMASVEQIRADISGEGFADLMVSTFDRVVCARTDAKRSRFAAIIARQLVKAEPWEDAEMAVRLLGDLEDIHLDVLGVALDRTDQEVRGPRVVDLGAPEDTDVIGQSHLSDILPQHATAALRMACAELVARGLLSDFGADRWDGGVMRSFVATDLAAWFSGWLVTAVG